jgi:replicative DNA helicase
MNQPWLAAESETQARIPPQSLEAERSVLAAMCLAKEAIARAVERLEERSFYRESHRRIWMAMLALFERGEVVDLITLREELQRRGELESVGGASYLTDLFEYLPTASNVDYHAKIVAEKAILRHLIDGATSIVEESYRGAEPAASILDRAQQRIFDISASRARQGFISMKQVVMDTFEIIQNLYDRKSHVTGLESGFIDLDAKTAGFQKSDLIIVAGRPSMGKTSFCLNIAEHLAIRRQTPVAFFSLEMSKEQVAQRMLCSQARVDGHRLRTGFLADNEWPALTRAASQLSEAPIYIDDSPSLSILEVRAKARRLATEVPNLGLVIVDYLQLMRGGEDVENRQQEISRISQSLKSLAKELAVPVIALSQLSRAVETRGGDRRPVLSDLRESGAIEQDADVVIFIYRPELYDQENEEVRGIAEVIIGKQRNGPIGNFKLSFMSSYARFENLAQMAQMAEAPF